MTNVVKRSSLNKLVVLKRIKHLSEQRQWSFLAPDARAELAQIPMANGHKHWEQSISDLERIAVAHFMRISEDEPKLL
jgi:hypothetical protein